MDHRDLPGSFSVPGDGDQAVRRRQRAPRRTGGHRAQLTVPDDMWRELTSIAQATGTTANDALVRLAADRLQDRRRALALQRRADARWRAFTEDEDEESDTTPEPLSEEELLELSSAFREDG
jgi:hypothetical protein